VATAAETFTLAGLDTIWSSVRRSHELLKAADIPHALVGGIAVCLHGYRRTTIDIDLLIRSEDSEQIKQVFQDADWTRSPEQAEFRDSNGVPLQFLISGERAGRGSEVLLPDPRNSDHLTELEGLPVLSLQRLIESKLACGMGNPRRIHRDFADVLELIATHQLTGSFARWLHKSVRESFRELVRASRPAE